MTHSLADKIQQALRAMRKAPELPERLVLVAGPSKSGKTRALQAVAAREQLPLLNLNLELSRRLLDLSQRQRVLQLRDALASILHGLSQDAVLLDNTEILFDPDLQQHPLHLLRAFSRDRILVASWNGVVKRDGRHHWMVHARPGHPAYFCEKVEGILLVASPNGIVDVR